MPEPPPKDFTFYALATYYYTTSQLRNTETIHFAHEDDLRNEINQYCARTWSDIVKDNNADLEYLHNYCFSLNYMFDYLKYVYKFDGKHFNKIEFKEKLNGHDLGWSLGMLYCCK